MTPPKCYSPALVALLLGAFLIPHPAGAQELPDHATDGAEAAPKGDRRRAASQGEEAEEGAAKDPEKPEKKKEELPTPGEFLEGFERFPGLFPIFQDPLTGKAYFVIRTRQLENTYLHFNHTLDGVAALGNFRGRYGRASVLRFRQHFQRLDVLRENTSFYIDPESALANAAGANVSPALLASLPLVAADQNRLVVEAAPLFLSEALAPLVGQSQREAGLSFSPSRSRITNILNYPENTDLVLEYAFEDSKSSSSGDGVTDPRFLQASVRHTLLKAPDNGYQARRDDPRVGFFSTQITDLASPHPAPYRDVIHRWHFERRRPNADLSRPVEPLVWWIENSTPHEFREIVRSATLLWNEAFESAGIQHAIEVRQQPDDADWDAGDIRYHVIRWASSPSPPFAGYGPSFTDPRTGQIIGADIMLEHSALTFRVRQGRLLGTRPLTEASQLSASAEAWDPASTFENPLSCMLSDGLQHSLQLGLAAARLDPAAAIDPDRLLEEALIKLVLHEVGHCLGLTHNFQASHLHSPDRIHNRRLTERVGLYASVMDYPSINLAPPETRQGQFYSTRPGAYDHWAITYGYSQALADPAAEEGRLQQILARSTEPALAYANDADDMRSTGRGIDPRAMIWDLSSDPLSYGIGRLAKVEELQATLLERLPSEGESFQELRSAYFTLRRERASALAAISRYVGGVFVDRATRGQLGASTPFQPVPAEQQRAAMEAIAKHAFSTAAPDPQLLAHLQIQRRGFDFYGETEDPKIHQAELALQRSLLDHLLHPNTLERIINSQLYGNAYPIHEMVADLSTAIFALDPDQPTDLFRQNLQIEAARSMLALLDPGKLLPAAQSPIRAALAEAAQAAAELANAAPARPDTPHLTHLATLITKALEEA
jgi:hypothetical protein